MENGKRKTAGRRGLGRAIRETGVTSLRCNSNIDMSDWLVLRRSVSGEDHRVAAVEEEAG